MNIDIEYIRAQLQRRRDQRQLAAVARATQITTRTLANIIAGKPGRTTVATTLQEFLKRTEAERRIEHAGK